MVCPHIPARMKEADEPARDRVERSDVAALVAITVVTGVRQIRRIGRAAVLLADSVVNLAAVETVSGVEKAVFAAVPRPRNNQTPQRRRNITDAHRGLLLRRSGLGEAGMGAGFGDAEDMFQMPEMV